MASADPLLQLRRVDAQLLAAQRSDPPAPTAPLAIDLDLPGDSRLTLAFHAYRTHRPVGRRKALAYAWRALLRTPIQPVNH